MRVSHYWLAVTACGNCLQWRQDMNYLLCSGAVSGGQEASVRSHLGLKLIRGWFCRSYFQNWIILLLCVTLYYSVCQILEHSNSKIVCGTDRGVFVRLGGSKDQIFKNR